jgi:hypothetical protein
MKSLYRESFERMLRVNRLRLDIRAIIPKVDNYAGLHHTSRAQQCDKLSDFRYEPPQSSLYPKVDSTEVESAGKMATPLPGSHTYNSPAASGHARQLNGDVRGQVHLGDTIHYGR